MHKTLSILSKKYSQLFQLESLLKKFSEFLRFYFDFSVKNYPDLKKIIEISVNYSNVLLF